MRLKDGKRQEQREQEEAMVSLEVCSRCQLPSCYSLSDIAPVAQAYRAICAQDNFEVAGDFEGTLVAGTLTFDGREEPFTSVSPAHVEVVLAPHEGTETVVGVGASRCVEGESVQLGATAVVPFCVVDSGKSVFVVASPVMAIPSFSSTEGDSAPSA